MDEIVKTENMKQKLVYATVTYTNKSDREINHMLYIGTLMLMNHKDGAYQIIKAWRAYTGEYGMDRE